MFIIINACFFFFSFRFTLLFHFPLFLTLNPFLCKKIYNIIKWTYIFAIPLWFHQNFHITFLTHLFLLFYGGYFHILCFSFGILHVFCGENLFPCSICLFFFLSFRFSWKIICHGKCNLLFHSNNLFVCLHVDFLIFNLWFYFWTKSHQLTFRTISFLFHQIFTY